jgi:copper chaperone
MTTKTLNVPDISCEHCERAIKSALEPIGGVQSVDVDIPAKKVKVAYDEGKVTLARITAAVEGEDYPVAGVE